jgi:hypothetical protein
MTLDRAELTGTGAAVVFHVALIAALSMSLASVSRSPEPPSMEVELVDEVGLQSASPEPAAPPPSSQAPEIGEAEPFRAPALAPPPPQPRPIPTPNVDAAERRQREIAARRAAREAAEKPAPRVSRIGDDFLKGVADSSSGSSASKPAARFDAKAKAGIASLFQRLVQPCANKQINPGEGANRIRVTVNLRIRRNGSLASASVVRVSGVDGDNERYEERVKDLATAVYRECSPFSGLPPELYQTAEGGWSNINLTYKLP